MAVATGSLRARDMSNQVFEEPSLEAGGQVRHSVCAHECTVPQPKRNFLICWFRELAFYFLPFDKMTDGQILVTVRLSGILVRTQPFNMHT